MKQISKTAVAVAVAVCVLTGCAESAAGESGFANSGFESGTLENWTAEGNAFDDSCVSRKTVSASGETYWQEGKYFLSGENAPAGATGTLTSETFKLTGNGRIGFLIGAGADPQKCYVALCDEDGNELLKQGNDGYGATGFTDGMYRVVLDAKNYLGKKVKMKIVDSDAGRTAHSYLNVDDFIVNYTGETEIPGVTLSADKYIARNAPLVDTTYRHTYHAMPPVGWMNDPNGFNYAFGKYHLFYQFYPYAAAWGPMHWGHYTTEDFVKWELQPTAIAPDSAYDADGCFSGTSIVKDNKFYLMYTSVFAGKQTQALARSEDGVHFKKAGEVIPSEDLPADCSRADFRDPKVFYRDGSYYAIMGSYSTDNCGQIILYKSADLYRWEFVGTLRKDNLTRGIYECPDLAEIDGADVLITSPQGYATQDWRYENVHSAIYVTGKLNTETGEFVSVYEDEIDSGFDFYAPQTLETTDGRIVMTAWMQMWTRSMPTSQHGWAGATILPRELSLKDGKLYQAPVREIENYRQNGVTDANVAIGEDTKIEGVSGTKVELKFTLDLGTASQVGVKLYAGEKNETRVYYDREKDRVIFDRSDMGVFITHDAKEHDASVRSCKVEIKDNKLEMRIFLDVSSCEVFLNGGERVMTGNVYSGANDTGISFFAVGEGAKLLNLEKYDIIV